MSKAAQSAPELPQGHTTLPAPSTATPGSHHRAFRVIRDECAKTPLRSCVAQVLHFGFLVLPASSFRFCVPVFAAVFGRVRSARRGEWVSNSS